MHLHRFLVVFVVFYTSSAVASLFDWNTEENFGNEELNVGDCNCKNGKCVKDSSGKEICVCNAEYGLYKKECQECKCGESISCTFEISGWNGAKICHCKSGYGQSSGGKCKECNCGENFNCTFTYAGIFSDDTKACLCPKGYAERSGECVVIDPCVKVTCQNGGTCEKNEGKATCKCPSGFSGTLCEKEPPLSTQSSTISTEPDVTTTSPKEPDASTVSPKEPDVSTVSPTDACTSNPCKNGGTCWLKGKGFYCDCKETFYGKTCENRCMCVNGRCQIEKGEVVCECNPGYGPYDYMVCKACNCGSGFSCKFKRGQFQIYDKKYCICPDGYYDEYGYCKEIFPSTSSASSTATPTFITDTTVNEADACIPNPCKNDGICKLESSNFSCFCKNPYFGETCENDPCSLNPCKNAGTCSLGMKDFICYCKRPYGGKTCEENLCSPNPCRNGGTCIPDTKDFTCSCEDPFTGKLCEISPCIPNPCRNGGSCILSASNFTCSCRGPYSGKFCEADPCSPSPCRNGGICKLAESNFTCFCKDPYSGKICEKNPCASNPCKNGGKCHAEGNAVKCLCPEPYSGTFCEKECRCENGHCEMVLGKMMCKCKPNFGLYSEGVCKACECGPKSKCTFRKGFFSDDKYCICPAGSAEYKGFCKACKCGPNVNCVFKKGFFMDEKFCFCPEGMDDHNGFCASEAAQLSSVIFIALLMLSLFISNHVYPVNI